MDNLIPQIQQAVKNICFKSVEPSDALISTKILDSINAVDLAVELENEFGISIPFVDINEQHFESVNTINNYVQLKLAAK
jgi:acyl carrier protein